MNRPLYIYGNWSVYDELSDGIELTESLAMRQLNEIARFRARGVQFDAYLMDAFWFAPDGGYRTWRKPHWPEGPDRWLDACGEANLLPGLWFTVNTLCHLEATPRWESSVGAKRWGMCLFEGGFLDDYMEVLDTWYARGIRLFKLDFADFDAVPAGQESEFTPGVAREQNISAFRRAFGEFRRRHLDAIVMGFNGFEQQECMDRTDRPLAPFIDPSWLEVLDCLYAGDPRPADVPCVSFWRAVDIYADHMTRAFHHAGLPLDRIDNCGFMAGNTGTCYWRAKEAWKGMLLLSLARGGRYHVAYGDLARFSDADAEMWAAAQRLYAPFLGHVSPIGGLPGQAEPYGWLGQVGCRQILTTVNPGLRPAELAIPRGDWQLLTSDLGFTPDIHQEALRLGAGQLAVLVSGEGAGESIALDEPLDIPTDGILVPPIEQDDRRATFAPGDASFLIVRQRQLNGESLRLYPTPETPLPFRLEVEGAVVIPQQTRFIWSGVSWCVWRVEPTETAWTVTLEPTHQEPVRYEWLTLRPRSESSGVQ